MKKEFKMKKKRAIRNFHSSFVTELKFSDPGKFYEMCKKIGAVDDINDGALKIQCLDGLSDRESAEAVAQHFAAISNEYKPVDLTVLPAFLPALPPMQFEEYEVYEKLKLLKTTKTTLPIDIPGKLRKEVAVELTAPLTHIINTAMATGHYPALWKREYVSPVPKIKEPQVIKDVRKIAGTSDYNKLLEGFLKDIFSSDVLPNIDPKQFGGRKKTGTEHMVVALMDRVLSLLDNNNTKSAVIMAAADWAAAFDRGDPTKTTSKLIRLKLRPSVVPLVISYMSGRSMSVKFNQSESGIYSLCGGFPQGSKIGQDCYQGASNDAADHVDMEDRFRYVDDLQILDLIMLTGILYDYDIYNHVASDIPLDHQFLNPADTQVQSHLYQLSLWTDQNLMKLNPAKCDYLILSRAQSDFVTRLTVNGTKIDQKEATKVLGCWIEEEPGKWAKNTCELVKSAYSRMSMLSKLKYTGVNRTDLLDIYKLFIRSRAEYMSVVWHSSLTAAQSHKIENIQKTSLKIILADSFTDYESGLEISGLSTLALRREARCLAFAKRCLTNKQTQHFFPLNPDNPQNVRNPEKYQVNFSHTENYRNSTVPFCQRLLNKDFLLEQEKRTEKERAGAERAEAERAGGERAVAARAGARGPGA